MEKSPAENVFITDKVADRDVVIKHIPTECMHMGGTPNPNKELLIWWVAGLRWTPTCFCLGIQSRTEVWMLSPQRRRCRVSSPPRACGTVISPKGILEECTGMCWEYMSIGNRLNGVMLSLCGASTRIMSWVSKVAELRQLERAHFLTIIHVYIYFALHNTLIAWDKRGRRSLYEAVFQHQDTNVV